MSGLLAVGYFLTSIIFSVIIFILWCRIALRYLLVSALHPIVQMLNNLSDPVIAPIAKLIRTSRIGRYDWAAFVILILVEVAQFVVLGLFLIHTLMPIYLVLLYTIADLIIQPCGLLFYAILIRVILSWVNPNWNHPIVDIIYRLTDPLINFVRGFLPIIAGIDLLYVKPWLKMVE